MSMWSILAGFAPVVVLLLVLWRMDSFRLVRGRRVFLASAVGAVVALVALAANRVASEWLCVPHTALCDWIAPVAEELAKAAIVGAAIRVGRVGFVVDAAILGFALGTGFALAENLHYAFTLHDGSTWLWLLRGCGTAVMHGSTTATFAVLGKALSDRYPTAGAWALLPGLLVAMLVHAAFNQLVLPPVVMTAVLLGLMPLLLLGACEYSERVTRAWLASGFHGETEMLERILEGDTASTPVGEFLDSVRDRFPPMVVADLFCLVTVHLELSLRAKGMLLARAAGVELPVDDTVRANLEELRHLERTVGPTGRLALQPLLRTSRRELWQVLMLAGAAGAAPGRPVLRAQPRPAPGR